nr:GHKL domain-containing protein [uncultured Sellimonas sp.]
MMAELLSVYAILMEILSFYFIAGGEFEKRYTKRKMYATAIAASLILGIFFLQQLSFVHIFLKTIFALLFWNCILLFFYKGTSWKKIFVAFSYYVYMYAVDYAVMFLMQLFSGESIQNLQQSRLVWSLGLILAKNILLFSCMIIGNKMQKKRANEKKSVLYWLQILIVPIGMVLNLCLIIFFAIRENRINVWIGMDIAVLTIGNVLFLFIEQKLEKESFIRRKNQELSGMIESERKQVSLLVESYREQQKIIHDFRNHLYVLDGLMNSEKYTESTEYLKKLLQEEMEWKAVVHTNHAVIDAILNRFYLEAKRNHISVEFELTSLENIQIPENDLAVIATNLLNNAIEAANEVSKDRRIIVRILDQEKELLISVRNTTIHSNVLEDGEIQTTKADKKKHGYGLGNVKRISEKYDGKYAVICKNGWFQATILFLKKIGNKK